MQREEIDEFSVGNGVMHILVGRIVGDSVCRG